MQPYRDDVKLRLWLQMAATDMHNLQTGSKVVQIIVIQCQHANYSVRADLDSSSNEITGSDPVGDKNKSVLKTKSLCSTKNHAVKTYGGVEV